MTTADYSGNLFQLDMSGNIIGTYTCLPEYDISGGCTMANTTTYGEVLVVLQQSDPDQLVFYDIHSATIDVQKDLWVDVPITGPYEICLYDSYGDGWDWTYVPVGNYILVYVNGIEVGNYTLLTGTGPECHNITVAPGDEITVDYVGNGPYQGENSYEIYDNVGNLILSRTASDVLPGELIVTSGYWDPVDTSGDAIDVAISTIITFRITLTNTGLFPVYDPWFYDWYDASLEFVDADPYPTTVDPIGYFLAWEDLFPGVLNPGESISINVSFHVVGPHCSIEKHRRS
jgi:hypothetical protein